MKNALKSDYLQGFIYGMLLMLSVTHWWGLLFSAITAWLWAAGGVGWKGWNGWRRWLMPFFTFMVIDAFHESVGLSSTQMSIALIGMGLQMGVLCIGYGVPDANDSKGSALGRIFGPFTRVVWWGILLIAMIPTFMGITILK